MIYRNPLPNRVRVLILGGGIHGTGLLHDMASRGWRDIHLVEKTRIGAGTSSRSTKLIHGGLRYLRHIRDFRLVFEALHERAVLQKVAPDLVNPIELILPVLKKRGMPGFFMRTGLFLYDILAGKSRIHSHQKISFDDMARKVPRVDPEPLKTAYSYWDMQTDDLRLVRRIAASASKLGGGITEGVEVVKVNLSPDGWDVLVKDQAGELKNISALYVFNALGPWANKILEESDIVPPYVGVNSKGVHLLLDDLGHKSGMFLQSPEDNRMFFVLPWFGHTLIGTTETDYRDDPDDLKSNAQDIEYLLKNCNRYFKTPISENDIRATFAGLRWLAVERGANLGDISRNDVIGRSTSNRGLLYTLYGGKLTTYRALSESLGDEISRHFGEFHASKTMNVDAWIKAEEMPEYDNNVLGRFLDGGISS